MVISTHISNFKTGKIVNGMSYTTYRVFCATPADLEQEQKAFHDVIGQVNEEEAMANDLLFVPVSILPNMVDTHFFHHLIVENIQDCTFFVQILDKTWGPRTRNCEWKYELACKLKNDPASRLQDVAIFFKDRDERLIEAEILHFKASVLESPGSYCFKNLSQFKERLRSQLSAWQRSILAQTK